MIEFRKVTSDNSRACFNMDAGDHGDYVAPNTISLAEAYLAIANDMCIPMPFAIYNKEEMVGFIQLAFLREDQDDELKEDLYEIWRLMIDEKHQGKGYGKESLKKAIEFVKTFPQGKAENLYLSYVPGNDKALHIYEESGFVKTGKIIEGEVLMTYKLL